MVPESRRDSETRARVSCRQPSFPAFEFFDQRTRDVGAADRDRRGPTAQAAAQLAPVSIVCASKPGERTNCAADTSAGVVLKRSTGESPCLLGRTWGYDQANIWVSDGCSGEFITGEAAQPETTKPKPLQYIPNVGFLLVDGEKGQIYFRLFSYARYLNQRNLDETYVDAFGNTQTIARRQDVQLQKFFAPFSGWFLTPKFRYYLYVWSANTAQGDPAQVVGAGISRSASTGTSPSVPASRPFPPHGARKANSRTG